VRTREPEPVALGYGSVGSDLDYGFSSPGEYESIDERLSSLRAELDGGGNGNGNGWGGTSSEPEPISERESLFESGSEPESAEEEEGLSLRARLARAAAARRRGPIA
jgi:hypothetical protein